MAKGFLGAIFGQKTFILLSLPIFGFLSFVLKEESVSEETRLDVRLSMSRAGGQGCLFKENLCSVIGNIR